MLVVKDESITAPIEVSLPLDDLRYKDAAGKWPDGWRLMKKSEFYALIESKALNRGFTILEEKSFGNFFTACTFPLRGFERLSVRLVR